MIPLPWRKKERPSEASPSVTWKDLMDSRGLALWTTRSQALGSKKENPYVELPLRKRALLERSSPPTVAVITCPHFFLALEKEQDTIKVSKSKSTIQDTSDDEDQNPHDPLTNTRCHHHYHGFDKPVDLNPGCSRPLTRCTGDEWTRQREQVTSAFQNLPARSLEAVRRVDVDSILALAAVWRHHGDKRMCYLDWQYVARSIALKWVVRLFGGPFVSPRPAEDSKRKLEQMSFERSLEHTLLEYWKSIRSKTVTSEKVIQKKRDEVVASLTLGGGGVLDSLFASGLSGQEAFDNALNAMIAAFDAAQSLLFWIIVNLSKTKSGWDECQQCVLQEEVYEKDLKGLAKFKQVAAQGKMTDYSSLSYLGRAVCETVRVYPPVWTLPRTWPMESHLVDLSQSQSVCCSKVDVLTINGVEHPHEDWHPEDVKSCHIASFGLGRRSCPAGTAALCAVYHASTEVLKRVECMEYSLKWKSPVDSTMLVPTLSIGSPYCPFYHTKLRGTAECNALQD